MRRDYSLHLCHSLLTLEPPLTPWSAAHPPARLLAHHLCQLEHVENLEHTEGRLPTSGLFFKANKEMVARLGIGKGAGSKRRRLTGITVAFDNKSTGNIAVGDEHAASFDVKFNKEDDGAVTECFEMADGTGTLKAGGTVLGKLQLGRTGNDHKAIAAGLTGYRTPPHPFERTLSLSLFFLPALGWRVEGGTDAPLHRCTVPPIPHREPIGRR